MTTLIFDKRTHSLLMLVVILAVLIRIVVVGVAIQHPQRTLTPDSPTYIRPALVLISEGAYNDPSAYRTPIYPLFLSLFFFIFGENPVPVVIAQVVLNVLTLIFIYKLASALFSSRTGALGTILQALAVESTLAAFFILTDVLFTLILALTTYALYQYRRKPTWQWVAIAALTVGIGILTRPIALLYPLVLIAILWINPMSWRQRLWQAALSLGIVAVVVLPWMLRNYWLLDSFSLSTISGDNLLYFQAGYVRADLLNQPIGAVRATLKTEVETILQQEALPNTEVNRARVAEHLARAIILQDPVRFVFVHLKGDLKGLLPGVATILNVFGIQEGRADALTTLQFGGWQTALENYFGDQQWIILILIPFFVILGAVYLGSALGVFVLIKQRRWFELVLLLAPIVYFLGMPGGASSARFRVPVMPYLCILGGVGLTAAWNWLQTARKGMPVDR